ncbi:unnamed protein product [Colias eurytheme]|nr:unnamed protein product [Colias eurytheme]
MNFLYSKTGNTFPNKAARLSTLKLFSHLVLTVVRESVQHELMTSSELVYIRCLLTNATSLADSLRFLAVSLPMEPNWMFCHPSADQSCINSEDILMRCIAKNVTNIKATSVHFHYE